MHSLRDSISGILKAYGLYEPVQLHQAVVLWEKIVGPTVAKHIRAVEVRGRTLLVKTDNPAWRTELAFQKDELLRIINEKIGPNTIRDIRFR